MDTSFISITAVAFQIGSLSVRWYGIIISLGMALGIYLAYRQERTPRPRPSTQYAVDFDPCGYHWR